jgi:RNA polymerase sigma-B factor
MGTRLLSPAPTADIRDDERMDADRELFQRLADDRDPVDRDLVVERFLPLARSIAARYHRSNEPFDDVFQVACLGLVKAIDRYDLSRGRAFSSFAIPTIAGEIKRYYRDRTWSVHVPRDLQDRALAMDRVRGELEAELGRSPTVTDIAERLEISEEDVLEALQARHAHGATSLDAPAGDHEAGAVLGDLLPSHEEGFARAETAADLEALGRVLKPRERLIIRLRFERDLSQREIGDLVGLSQMQVSRLLRDALARLREYHHQAASKRYSAPACAAPPSARRHDHGVRPRSRRASTLPRLVPTPAG